MPNTQGQARRSIVYRAAQGATFATFLVVSPISAGAREAQPRSTAPDTDPLSEIALLDNQAAQSVALI